MEVRYCICGKELTGKQVYCSPACRKKASRSVTSSVTSEPASVTKCDIITPKCDIKPPSVTKVTVAGQVVELGKPYSTDRDNRWAPNYDLSEEGFRRRNKTWDERPKAKREATMEAVRRMHAAHVAKVASNTASRRAIVQACAV